MNGVEQRDRNMANDPIFEPLKFRTVTVKNRIFRSNISGRFDNYDGSGTQARINWELKFARGGVGGIITSFAPVHGQGRIMPNYARIDSDDKIPFWRELVHRVHEHDCRLFIQLSHSGRQRDLPSLEYPGPAVSSTSRPEDLHGLASRALTVGEIQEVVDYFAEGARRAREAGADGVELHGANGYLFTQFLSSAINDRKDEYGGSLENRARFAREVIRAIRKKVGPDFHVQYKISATEYADALAPWLTKGNTIDDSVQVVKWLEEDGIDAVHVSSGSSFPHPHNPAGGFPPNANTVYDVMLRSGRNTAHNYWLFNHQPFFALFKWWWKRRGGPDNPEGANLPDAARLRRELKIPVICTGGFQTASVIRAAIAEGKTDAVSIARPLVANNHLVQMFAGGLDRAPRPCTYCNKCLGAVLKYPLGCYDESRYESYDAMIREIMTVFEPPPYAGAGDGATAGTPASAMAGAKGKGKS
jgi:2,4-dienoyl-CoA reductase-like NADH-dependent reductase (Old Yellow Enzyme family)